MKNQSKEAAFKCPGVNIYNMSIKNDVAEYIRSGETHNQELGLEIEHFVIDHDGKQIGFHEISELISIIGNLLKAKIIYMDGYPVGYVTDEYSVTLEPACQFEISINPYSDISEIRRVYNDFYGLWQPLFNARGYKFETKGNLPLVEQGKVDPDDITLSPKSRYKYMDTYFRHSGHYGKYMMRASASTQVSIDFSSETDLVRKLNVLQKISPVLMIAMENKSCPDSTLKEHPDKPHLFRIQEWDDLDKDRTGFYPNSLEPDFGYDSAADVIIRTPLILLTDNGETTDVGSENAYDLFAKGLLKEDKLEPARRTKLIEHFISMGFFHFRIKKYIEVRVADSVPLERALGYVALIKGIVYSDENLNILEKELSDVDSLSKIQEAVEEIETHGYDAIIYGGHTAASWAAHLTELALNKLNDSDKVYLNNVRTFWGIG